MDSIEKPLDEIISIRKEKLKKLAESGLEAYPNKFDFTHKLSEVQAKYARLEIGGKSEDVLRVCGRLVALREMGKATFGHIADSTGKLQVYLRQNMLGEQQYRKFRDIFDIGDFMGIEGKPFRTKTGELTVDVSSWVFLSKALRPLPEKWHGLKDIDIRYRQRYLDLISNEGVRKIFQARTFIINYIREFLNTSGFLEVETPIMQFLHGGAAAKPFKTYHNTYHLDLYLRIAPEIALKTLTVGGLDKIYEIAKNFRNEGIDRRHNPEFTMIEIYQTYSDYNDMIKLCSDIICYVVGKLGIDKRVTYGDCAFDVTDFKIVKLEDLFKSELNLDMADIIQNNKLKKIADELKLDIPKDTDDKKIFDTLFDTYIQPKLITPTFVIDYPKAYSPLAKSKKENNFYAERFELFMGAEELANAYSELNDPAEQKERFIQQSKDKGDETHPYDENFITALEYGMPPCGGLGIGIDRLVMILTNSTSIREVVLFPLLKPEQK